MGTDPAAASERASSQRLGAGEANRGRQWSIRFSGWLLASAGVLSPKLPSPVRQYLPFFRFSRRRLFHPVAQCVSPSNHKPDQCSLFRARAACCRLAAGFLSWDNSVELSVARMRSRCRTMAQPKRFDDEFVVVINSAAEPQWEPVPSLPAVLTKRVSVVWPGTGTTLAGTCRDRSCRCGVPHSQLSAVGGLKLEPVNLGLKLVWWDAGPHLAIVEYCNTFEV